MDDVCEVESADGTVIAFRRTGRGRPVVLVGGAFGTMETSAPLAALLAHRFSVVSYDRRGRGASGDTAPYAVAREVDDIAALLAAAGGTASAVGVSSGGALVLEAAAAGLPFESLAVYEPPYRASEAELRGRPAFRRRLAALLAEDRREEAIGHALSVVGVTAADIAELRGTDAWPGLLALAPTLAYDDAVQGDGRVPVERLARVAVRSAVIDGGASPAPWRDGAAAVARALPRGRHRTLTGQNHHVAPQVLAPALEAFLTG